MRVLLDTNQLVRALMRPPELATFIMAWEARRFEVIASAEVVDEYERVLAYPDVATLIYPGLLRAFRSHLIHELALIEVTETPRLCRDSADDKIIAAALAGEVDYLLTADEDLLDPPIVSLLRAAGIEVITIDDLICLLDSLP